MDQEPSPVRAVQLCHDLLKWLVPQLDHFPRSRRFSLGARIETTLLDVLSALIAASYSRRKSNSLSSANQQLAIVRHLWRLSLELRVIDQRRYQFGSERLLELGSQIGGWQKHAQNS
jgi:hypothetical protein